MNSTDTTNSGSSPKRKWLLVFVALSIGCGALLVAAATKFNFGEKSEPVVASREISWENLIPADYVPPENPLRTMTQEQLDKLFDGSAESQKELAEIEEILSYAPVNEELDGEVVSLPGYVVPLEADDQTSLREFLLVPYFGACIHTPPPPANQLVYANSGDTIELTDTYTPVVVTGRLSAETIISDIAESGYQMDVLQVKPYEQQN